MDDTTDKPTNCGLVLDAAKERQIYRAYFGCCWFLFFVFYVAQSYKSKIPSFRCKRNLRKHRTYIHNEPKLCQASTDVSGVTFLVFLTHHLFFSLFPYLLRGVGRGRGHFAITRLQLQGYNLQVTLQVTRLQVTRYNCLSNLASHPRTFPVNNAIMTRSPLRKGPFSRGVPLVVLRATS